jgi:hypothetical protein
LKNAGEKLAEVEGKLLREQRKNKNQHDQPTTTTRKIGSREIDEGGRVDIVRREGTDQERSAPCADADPTSDEC